MSIEPRLSFLNSRVLGRQDSLDLILSRLRCAGYEISNRSGKHAESSGNQDTECGELGLGLAYNERCLSFGASIGASAQGLEPLELLVDMYWGKSYLGEEGTAYASATTLQTPLFNYSEYRPEHYARLLIEFGRTLYGAVLPDFGWIDVTEPAGYTWFDDVRQRAIPHFYWANFFGPVYTEKWGKKAMLTAPAWLAQELEDGGVLLVLSPAPGWSSKPRASAEAIRQHLVGQSQDSENDSRRPKSM